MAPAASSVVNTITDFAYQELTFGSRDNAGVIVLTPAASEPSIQVWEPDTFLKFRPRTTWAVMGSGSGFASKVRERERKLGFLRAPTTIQDMLVMVSQYADAANESLTVDDQHLIGFLLHGKAYAFGHLGISPKYSSVPQILDPAAWTQASNAFDQVRAIIGPIVSSLQTARRALSEIYTAETTTVIDSAQISSCISDIANYRALLETKLADYCTWYDSLISRP
jgi:hypothetical protein